MLGTQALPNLQIDQRVRLRARLVALSVAALFCAQVGYVAIAEEPYPAIMMPRFSWAGPTQASVVDIPVPEISLRFADGKSLVLSQNELLREFPTGHHNSIMASLLAPLPPVPATRRAPAGKFEPPTWLFPGYGRARANRTSPEHVASLKAWLTKRSREIYPAAPVLKCVVDWYDDSYRYDTSGEHQGFRQGHRLTGSFEIDLNANATSLY